MLHKHTKEHHQGAGASFHHNSHSAPVSYKLLSDDLQKMALEDTDAKLNVSVTNKYTIPAKGLPKDLTYDLVHNELTLDGNPHLNLASFVNTTSTETAKRLITENINKNLADNDEYPQLMEITQRCVSMLAQLWHCDVDKEPLGCATTGSSEAIMLGGLAMKRQWERKMREAGKSTAKPNIIMSSAAQVALEKFARYFDVECRLVPVSQQSDFHLDPKSLWEFVDENTIGCYVILGTTYTGHLENIEQVAGVLEEIERENPNWSNTDIPIHVDGASGGFVVPFAFTQEQMERAGLSRWGFNHPRVVSINTSGHKFGLTTPGLGWILWKDDSYLLPELRFRLKYLGGVEETFNLNFSRPGFQVIHQYYNFLTLGMKGYKEVFDRSLFVARAFSLALLNEADLAGNFEVVSCIHERLDGEPACNRDVLEDPQNFRPGVPLVAFRLSKQFHEKYPEIPQAILSTMLRGKGWIIPNYPLPASTDGSDKTEVLRVVFRSEMSLDLAHLLLDHLVHVIHRLMHVYEGAAATSGQQGRGTLYETLLTLASSGDEEEAAATEAHKKNYRGTC
ncbi:LAFE_0G15632g1_1 [Lachancea fermentati]|uniref:Glutamate decarboxylase n=1 Tax=Lachancea fermentati TaxID=4955 RepID=A0A1G4MIR8_LACFM|nr:LAFE_0G15632g1_1 [Lachancea fermentati]